MRVCAAARKHPASACSVSCSAVLNFVKTSSSRGHPGMRCWRALGCVAAHAYMALSVLTLAFFHEATARFSPPPSALLAIAGSRRQR